MYILVPRNYGCAISYFWDNALKFKFLKYYPLKGVREIGGNWLSPLSLEELA
jgi:hypothetical protein